MTKFCNNVRTDMGWPLRDNLEAVYLQSEDMGGISFTTGRMIHKICFITMNRKYD